MEYGFFFINQTAQLIIQIQFFRNSFFEYNFTNENKISTDTCLNKENIIKTILIVSVAANKGEAEPERKETRTKVDEDRKHEYPLVLIIKHGVQQVVWCFTPSG